MPAAGNFHDREEVRQRAGGRMPRASQFFRPEFGGRIEVPPRIVGQLRPGTLRQPLQRDPTAPAG